MSKNKVQEYSDYHEYLKVRTLKSKLYRRFILYPKLSSFMHGLGLDLGAGIGEFVAFRPNTIGVEINFKNVSLCKSKGLDVRQMDIDLLPFNDNQFDSIIMDNVLEHIENPKPILSEIDRTLKKNGVLIVGVPGVLGYKADPDHKIFYSKEDLKTMFVIQGYMVEKIFSMPFEFSWLDTRITQYCYYGVFRKV
jgi:SAM-dependent methyltransferase